MVTKTAHPYVIRNPEILGGEPIIHGTRTPVRAIVEYWRLGIHPEEIPSRLPHLTLAQVFDALSFFSDKRQLEFAIQTNRALLTHNYQMTPVGP